MTKPAFILKRCRLCKSIDLKPVIDLGNSPPPNNLLKKKDLNSKENIFPLKVNFCKDCGQLQLSHVVNPELMFSSYTYLSSVMKDHFVTYAETVIKKIKPTKMSLVVEIGSNDGTLLKEFKKGGLKVLGVDPAKNIARTATAEGIYTIADFFNTKISAKIVKKYGKAQIIPANNVFAHINDLDEIVKAVNILLDDNGVFIIEFPYVLNLIKDNVFDSIYHEHLSYLAISPLSKFFQRFKMKIVDIKKTPVQGGSLMIFVQKSIGKFKTSKSVSKYLKLEKENKLNKIPTYDIFFKKIKKTKTDLNKMLLKLKKQGKKIAGYGAPGRSTTLLNYFAIDKKILEYIVDDNPLKVGLFTPGTHIPILKVAEIKKNPPDYLLILSWNYAKPIIQKLEYYKRAGGKFIIPVPKPKII